MFEKRYLPILLLLGLLFTFTAIVTLKNIVDEHKRIADELSPMVAICQKALSSAGYTAYTCQGTVFYSHPKYERTEFSPLSVTVYFDDGTNDMWCHMQRRGSEWVVIGTGSTLVGICP